MSKGLCSHLHTATTVNIIFVVLFRSVRHTDDLLIFFLLKKGMFKFPCLQVCWLYSKT